MGHDCNKKYSTIITISNQIYRQQRNLCKKGQNVAINTKLSPFEYLVLCYVINLVNSNITGKIT